MTYLVSSFSQLPEISCKFYIVLMEYKNPTKFSSSNFLIEERVRSFLFFFIYFSIFSIR